MSFGSILKEARLKKGLSLREAEKLIGLSYGYLGLIERGQRLPPRREILVRLAEVYGLDFHSLLVEAIIETAKADLVALFCRYSDHPAASLGVEGIRQKYSDEQIQEFVREWLSSLPESAWPLEVLKVLGNPRS